MTSTSLNELQLLLSYNDLHNITFNITLLNALLEAGVSKIMVNSTEVVFSNLIPNSVYAVNIFAVNSAGSKTEIITAYTCELHAEFLHGWYKYILLQCHLVH